MLHVLEHHDERVSVHTHAVELDNVVVLEVGQQLGLPLEILPGRQVGIFQGLQANKVQVMPSGEAPAAAAAAC